MAYTLTATYDNPPSATLTLTSDSAFSTTPRYRFKIYSDSEGTQLVTNSGWITLSEASTTITYTVASINSGTYYVTAESDDPQTFVSLQEVVLADNTPKTATQSQWADLASRVKAKANTSSLSTVATSGSYVDLSNKPTVPTITMTTTDPGEGSALADNNYVAVYGGDPIIMDYSTTEINTGAKWIDGSAIYKKSVYISALPNAGNGSYSAGISNLSKVLKVEGIYYNNSGTFFPANTERPNATIGVGTYFENGDICIYTGTSDRSAYSGYVTLYYTKSS